MSTVRLLSKTVKKNKEVIIEKPIVKNNLDTAYGWITMAAEYMSQIENYGFKIVHSKKNDRLWFDIKDASWFIHPSDEDKKKALELREKLNTCILKCDYVESNVNSKTVNNLSTNIITYKEGDELFSERFSYYKELIATKNYKNPEGVKRKDSDIELQEDFDLEEFIRYRGPVVVAQEGLGGGARCVPKYGMDHIGGFKNKDGLYTENNFINKNNILGLKKNYRFSLSNSTKLSKYNWLDTEKRKSVIRYETTRYGYFYTDPEYDVYDDRITKIFCDDNNKKVIQEFNRGNVDVSIKYWENTIRETKCKSTAEEVYDFVCGVSDKTKKLFTFDNKLFNNIDKENRLIVTKKFNENNFTKSDLFQYSITLRQAKDTNGGIKHFINIHSGTFNYNSSQGCPTIYEDDYGDFINSFKNDKIGLFFLFR